jgi:DNA-binding winged helix-turn-helix (wHTH) protein
VVPIRLGDLTFDPDARQLLRGDSEIHLSPKAFELLKTLVEHRPRALSKNELHQHLWPRTFVSEANLASLIAEVREALGETAREPRFIRTAHRFGYAFAASTVEQATTVSAAPAAGVDTPVRFCWLIRDGKRLPLQAGENVLGRDADGVIGLGSPTVSRRHARVVILEAGASVEDLNSKNGTFLGGARVTNATALHDGDELRVGSVTLQFRTASASKTVTWKPGDV